MLPFDKVNKNNRSLYFKIWLATFLYTLTAALLIQLILLPYIFPAWHGGDGLLVGGDWLAYQRIAVDLKDKIQLEGWSAWQLRPYDSAPAGIAAIIYTITNVSKPWILLPFNAAVHAFSALILILLVNKITATEKPLVYSAIPFILFPTAMLWNAALHKDGLFILGCFLFIYGLISLIDVKQEYKLNQLGYGIVCLIIGLFLVWVVRPYGVDMILYIGILIAVPISIYLFFHLKNNRRLIINILIIWISMFFFVPFAQTAFQFRYVEIEYKELPVEAINMEYPDQINSERSEPEQQEEKSDEMLPIEDGTIWHQSTLLPEKVDEILYQVAVLRDHYRTSKPAASSNIDLGVQFQSAGDVIKYIPRALQLGLLAPFPNHWIERGSYTETTLMRRVVALEMIIIYVALIFSLLAIWIWRKRAEIYIISSFTVGMILTYSLVVVNIGTLHRMRYGFIMILVALGIASFMHFLNTRKKDQLSST